MPPKPSPQLEDVITSEHKLAIAIALSDIQLEALHESGQTLVEKRLHDLRDFVWDQINADDVAKKVAFDKALKGLDAAQTALLCESYARMGELYEVAAITGRDNYFKDLKDAPIPGGVEAYLNKQPDVKTALDKLAIPVFETCMTMHPTNAQGLAPMQALRAVCVALHAGDPVKIKEAVKAYQATPVLHVDEHGAENNLTVRDETKTVLNYLGNVYDDLPLIYKEYDEKLEKFAKEKHEEYDPVMLTLHAKFSSWGSAGDKDGNDMVTAEKTLEAVARHSYEIVHRYNKDLEAIVPTPEEGQPFIPKTQAQQALQGNKGILNVVEELLVGILEESQKLSNDADTMRKGLAKVRKDLGIDQIQVELKALHNDGQENSEAFKQKKSALADKTAQYEAAVEKVMPGSSALNERMDRISKSLSQARSMLNEKDFKEKLLEAEQHAVGDEKKQLLELLRKVRWFGFNFSDIEYRETADEYVKVMGELIPNYGEMLPGERVKRLTALLDGEDAQGFADTRAKAQKFLDAGAPKGLADKDDNTSITYHTLKRMELARDFSDMIKNNVLAECGSRDEDPPDPELIKSQGVANILEAQLLQRLVDKDGKKAMLGIVPLYEDYSTLENSSKIMEAAYSNPAYLRHLQDVAAFRGTGPTQQVQIAHSDNRRRVGSLAGTAYIHEAHEAIRAVNDAKGITTQFFEGGSMSDPFRNGVRAISAQVNAFGLHDFGKFTFQGRDLLQYFNHPGSNARFFVSHFVHPAAALEPGAYQGPDGNTLQGWVAPHYRNINPEDPTPTRFEGGKKPDRYPNQIIQKVALAALKDTRTEYHEKDFTPSALGTLLSVLGLGYQREAAASNRGSRAAARTAFSSSGVSTKIGAMIQPIALDKLRTIPFSMVPQQNRLNLAWVGGDKLEDHLNREIITELNKLSNASYVQTCIQQARDAVRDNEKDLAAQEMEEDIKFFIEKFSNVRSGKGVDSEEIHWLNEKSPAFRDAMDKAAFGMARTDMDAVAKDVEPKFNILAKEPKNSENSTYKMQGQGYVSRMQQTYNSMSQVAYAALTGQPLRGQNSPLDFKRYNDDRGESQGRIIGALNNINGLGEEIARRNNYQDFVVHAKNKLGAQDKLGENDRVLGILMAAGLTSTHSRWLSADDPEFAKHHLGAVKAVGMAR